MKVAVLSTKSDVVDCGRIATRLAIGYGIFILVGAFVLALVQQAFLCGYCNNDDPCHEFCGYSRTSASGDDATSDEEKPSSGWNKYTIVLCFFIFKVLWVS